MSTAVKLAVAIWEASAKAVLRVIVSAPSSRAEAGGRRGLAESLTAGAGSGGSAPGSRYAFSAIRTIASSAVR